MALMSYGIECGSTFSTGVAAQILQQQGVEVPAQMLDFFIANTIVGLNAQHEVEYLYPLSCTETGHQVVLEDGRTFFAMCAIDALGTGVTFGMKARITSYCIDSNETVQGLIDVKRINQMSPSELWVSYHDRWHGSEDAFNY